jgi:hypothetical protein
MLIVLISVSVVAAGFAYGYFKQRGELSTAGDVLAKYEATKSYADSLSKKVLELQEQNAYQTLELSKVRNASKDLEKKLANNTKPVEVVASPKVAVVYGENHPPKKNRRRPNKNKDNKQK